MLPQHLPHASATDDLAVTMPFPAWLTCVLEDRASAEPAI